MSESKNMRVGVRLWCGWFYYEWFKRKGDTIWLFLIIDGCGCGGGGVVLSTTKIAEL